MLHVECAMRSLTSSLAIEDSGLKLSFGFNSVARKKGIVSKVDSASGKDFVRFARSLKSISH